MPSGEDVEGQPSDRTLADGGAVAAPRTAATSKLLLVVVSVIADFLMTGIVYGYSGIVPVLTRDTKAFASQCAPGEALPCDQQIQLLTAAFTLSVSTISASGVPIGVVLDAVGPRHTTIIGSLVFAGGLLSFAVAPLISDQLYFAGFFLLSLGGPAIITATMNFADLFPSVASAIISAQNGAFDASSAVMFLMGKAVTGLGVSLGAVMLSYLSVPLTLIIIAALLFPDLPSGLQLPDPPTEKESSGGAAPPEGAPAPDTAPVAPAPQQAAPARTGELWRLYHVKLESSKVRAAAAASDAAVGVLAAEAAEENATSSLQEPLLPGSTAAAAAADAHGGTPVPYPPDVHNTDISLQMKSTVFWALVVVSSYLVTRSNFYIASINQQLAFSVELQAGPDGSMAQIAATTDYYVDIFNYIMPIGGALSVLLSGWFMVRLGLTSTFALIGAMCCTVSLLQIFAPVIPLDVQVAGFVVFAVLRAFIFGAIAAFMGQIFGFRNFGRLFGISRVAGAIVTVVQYPLIHYAEYQLQGDYRPIDCGFLIIELLLTTLYPYYLWKQVFYGYFFIPPVRGIAMSLS